MREKTTGTYNNPSMNVWKLRWTQAGLFLNQVFFSILTIITGSNTVRKRPQIINNDSYTAHKPATSGKTSNHSDCNNIADVFKLKAYKQIAELCYNVLKTFT